jgi:5-methylcytosine-specific restriction endonuclease McrA
MIAESQYPALLLNADYTPFSVHPLSVIPWQDAVRGIFADRLVTVSEYDRTLTGKTWEFKLPSVVAMRNYVKPRLRVPFTRANIWIRDEGKCVYCGDRVPPKDFTFDHVIPRSKGGGTDWDNISTACEPCNLRKGNHLPNEVGMIPSPWPYRPDRFEIAKKARRLGRYPATPKAWVDFIYWDSELETE